MDIKPLSIRTIKPAWSWTLKPLRLWTMKPLCLWTNEPLCLWTNKPLCLRTKKPLNPFSRKNCVAPKTDGAPMSTDKLAPKPRSCVMLSVCLSVRLSVCLCNLSCEQNLEKTANVTDLKLCSKMFLTYENDHLGFYISID